MLVISVCPLLSIAMQDNKEMFPLKVCICCETLTVWGAFEILYQTVEFVNVRKSWLFLAGTVHLLVWCEWGFRALRRGSSRQVRKERKEGETDRNPLAMPRFVRFPCSEHERKPCSIFEAELGLDAPPLFYQGQGRAFCWAFQPAAAKKR